ncbi:hypothetical protein [Pseudomonas fakonensis]|nr:hypothetical protein [Pseudomonas fakonensis]
MDTLKQGPQASFQQRSMYGGEFYATPISKLARDYAKEFNVDGSRYLGPYTVGGVSKPSYGKVYGVYAKNTESWVENVDYSYQREGGVIVFKESIFGDIKIHNQINGTVYDIRTGEAYVFRPYVR